MGPHVERGEAGRHVKSCALLPVLVVCWQGKAGRCFRNTHCPGALL